MSKGKAVNGWAWTLKNGNRGKKQNKIEMERAAFREECKKMRSKENVKQMMYGALKKDRQQSILQERI